MLHSRLLLKASAPGGSMGTEARPPAQRPTGRQEAAGRAGLCFMAMGRPAFRQGTDGAQRAGKAR